MRTSTKTRALRRVGHDFMKNKRNRLVVANLGWAEDIPEWLKEEVGKERIVNGMVGIFDNKNQEVGDAEACAYLFTASLTVPLSHNLGEAYIFLCAKIMGRKDPDNLVNFMKEKLKKGLSPDEERELKRLKNDIYHARGREVESPIFDVLKSLKKGIMT